METKEDIRKKVLKLRASMSEEDRILKSEAIYQKVVSHPLFLSCQEIYCYVSFRQETDTRKIIVKAWQLGKKTAVPKVLGKEMGFFYISSFEELKKGCMGIPEPEAVNPAKATHALLIMPGAVFDKEKNRIGYGGGYYDKYIADHPAYSKMAVCYSMQVIEKLPAKAYDMKPDIIITEEYEF